MVGYVVRKPGVQRAVLRRQVNLNPRKGMTLRQLIKVNSEIRLPLKNVASLRILKVEPGRVKMKGKLHKCVRFLIKDSLRTTPRDPIKRHSLIIMHHAPTTPQTKDVRMTDKNINVRVSCDCEAFMYMSEYALTHYQASWIKYSNGAPPLTTNGGLVPFTCKHVHLALSHILKKGW